MTIDEAIQVLNNTAVISSHEKNTYRDALNIAISGLEAWKDILHETGQEDMLCRHNADQQKMLDWARWLIKQEIKDIEAGRLIGQPSRRME